MHNTTDQTTEVSRHDNGWNNENNVHHLFSMETNTVMTGGLKINRTDVSQPVLLECLAEGQMSYLKSLRLASLLYNAHFRISVSAEKSIIFCNKGQFVFLLMSFLSLAFPLAFALPRIFFLRL